MSAGAWEVTAARLAADPADAIGGRSQRLRDVLRRCMGSAPPELESLAPPEPLFEHPYLRVAHRARAELTEAAKEVMDGLLTREFERVAPHLAPEITVLWPDGRLGRHRGEDVLRALHDQPAEAAPVLLRDVRTYLPGELRGVLPRGYADLLTAAVGDDSAVAVTAELSSRRGSQGRVTIFAASDIDHGGWRILNLPLPGLDDGHAASGKVSAAESEAVRVADRAIRHWCLGHPLQLRSLRNQMMPNLWLGAELIAAEALPDRAGGVDADAAGWRVFRGTSADPSLTMADVLAPDTARALEQRAKEAWRRPLAMLRPQWVRGDLGAVDPVTGKVHDEDPAYALLLRVVERVREEDVERWRLGGLFVP